MLFLWSFFAQADSNCLLESCPQSTQTVEYSVLNKPLKPCSTDPLTGFFRDSYCRTGSEDRGIHVVCARMTEGFLTYTKNQGNDLSTPAPQYGFPGLKPGDNWCLCAARWKESHNAGVAPLVYLEATAQETLKLIPLAVLEEQSTKER